jgi:Protein of unknown function (DUF5674)
MMVVGKVNYGARTGIQIVEFEALINIRPRDSNPSMIIQNTEIRQKVETVVRRYLEGAQP